MSGVRKELLNQDSAIRVAALTTFQIVVRPTMMSSDKDRGSAREMLQRDPQFIMSRLNKRRPD
jgi:hypothetical protein